MTAMLEVVGRKVHERRSKLEVLLDIMDVVSEGNTGPTKIMYQSNISWQTLQESLDILLSNGLLFEGSDNLRKFYRLTEKGFRVLNQYRGLREDLSVGMSN